MYLTVRYYVEYVREGAVTYIVYRLNLKHGNVRYKYTQYKIL